MKIVNETGWISTVKLYSCDCLKKYTKDYKSHSLWHQYEELTTSILNPSYKTTCHMCVPLCLCITIRLPRTVTARPELQQQNNHIKPWYKIAIHNEHTSSFSYVCNHSKGRRCKVEYPNGRIIKYRKLQSFSVYNNSRRHVKIRTGMWTNMFDTSSIRKWYVDDTASIRYIISIRNATHLKSKS